MRWDSPVQGLFRTTTQEFPVDDVVIPAGARVQLKYGSANRDERRYADADAFDITRDARDHLSFSGGVHYCLGAPLARLEARIVLEELLSRTMDLELRGAPERSSNVLVRGPVTLPVSFR